MTTLFEADIGIGYGAGSGVRSSIPAALNPDLDITYDCNGYDADWQPFQGVGFAYAIASGAKSGLATADDFTGIAYCLASGELLLSDSYSAEIGYGYARAYGELLLHSKPSTIAAKNNWVAWSKIGSLDFTIDSSNIAGKRPVDFAGPVYAVHKLGQSVIVYGLNGMSEMAPNNQFWGLKPLSNVGLMHANAIINIKDSVHWLINSNNQLCKYDGSMHVVGYQYLLKEMTNPTLVHDSYNDMIYICDGSVGYIYSIDTDCLCEGPPYITGFYRNSDNYYGLSSANVIYSPFYLLTDVTDFGTRKNKTVQNVEISTTMTENIMMRIHNRNLYEASFIQTPWVTFTGQGMAFIPCYGVEFMFEFMANTKEEDVSIDSININGFIHNVNYIDTFRGEG